MHDPISLRIAYRRVYGLLTKFVCSPLCGNTPRGGQQELCSQDLCPRSSGRNFGWNRHEWIRFVPASFKLTVFRSYWCLLRSPESLGCSVQHFSREFHVQTLTIYKPGFNRNDYTFTLILLIKISLCSKLHSTKFTNYKCYEMKSAPNLQGGLRARFI